jgi:choline transport protein
MNYTSAAVGIIMLLSLITWFTTGRKQFSGPEGGRVMSIVESVGTSVVTGGEKEKKADSE